MGAGCLMPLRLGLAEPLGTCGALQCSECCATMCLMSLGLAAKSRDTAHRDVLRLGCVAGCGRSSHPGQLRAILAECGPKSVQVASISVEVGQLLIGCGKGRPEFDHFGAI